MLKKIYVDANILLNIWRREKGPKTGKKLWKGSGEILEKIGLGRYQGGMGMTIVMEVLHAIRVGAMERENEWRKKIEKAINKLKAHEIEFVVPTDVVMSDVALGKEISRGNGR